MNVLNFTDLCAIISQGSADPQLLSLFNQRTSVGPGALMPATAANWSIAREGVGSEVSLKNYLGCDVATAEVVYADLPAPFLPDVLGPPPWLSRTIQMRLTQVRAEIRGATNGTLPSTLPSLRVYYPDGAIIQAASFDTPANNSAFEDIHYLSADIDPSVSAISGCFLARLTLPSGGGTQAGFRVFSIQATWELGVSPG